MKGANIALPHAFPVSCLTAATVMHLHLERFMMLAREEGARKAAARCCAGRRTGLRVAGAIAALGALLGLMMLAAPARAQSTFGSIRGSVEDASGAAIPGAQVTLHSLDENTDRTAASDEAGNYVLENVKPDNYSLRATHAGFTETVIDNIVLAARQDLRLRVEMPIAAQSTTVEVTASNTDINTENATVSDTKDTAQIGELPVNARAATTSPVAALATSASVQQDSQGNFAIGGATANMIGLSVDGISTVNVWMSGVSLAEGAQGSNPYPSSEGIAEMKVTAFNNNAEFSQVGDVTFTTKAGANAWHGSLFEYLQNDALNATTYNFAVKVPERFNTFGGSVSGPVVVPRLYNGHNKTFFFFDYEGNRRRTAQPEEYAVPSLEDRQGNLSDLAATISADPANANCPATGGCLINPATGQPFANFQITSPLNPTALALLDDYYPLPNANLGGGLNYETLVATPSNTDGLDGRIDYVINQKQQVFARYNWKNLFVDTVNPLLPNDVDTEHDRSFLVSHNYEIASRLVNEFRYGFTTSLFAPSFPIGGEQALSQLGLLGQWPAIPQIHRQQAGFPTFNFSQGTNFEPIGRDIVGPFNSYTYELADNLTWSYGRHTIRGGVDVRWLRDEVIALESPSDDFGLITFQPTFTGSAFGDFLLGLPYTTYFAWTGPNENPVGRQYGFYAQDEWQVNDRVTLNYGLRWELLPPFVDASGMEANFDAGRNAVIVDRKLYTDLGGPVANFLESFNACNAAPAGYAAPNDTGYAPDAAMPCTPVISNAEEGVGPGLRQTYRGNFDPRISVAYRPFGNDKTVVRGGFGIFTVTALGQLQNNNEGNPDISIDTYTNQNPATLLPSFQFPAVVPPSSGVAYGGGELEMATDPHYRDVQAAQYNLTVERALNNFTALRVSYVGMESYRMNVTVNFNQQMPSTVSPNPNPIPFPNWGTIFSTENLGHESYNAMEVQVTQRRFRGLTYQANYTWAHDLSDAQGDAPTTFQGETSYGLAVEDCFDLGANRGNVVGTRRQRLMLTGTYALPYGQGRQWSSSSRVLRGVLGNWDLNNITLLESGPYLTPTMSVSEDQTNTGPAAAGVIVVRPDRIGNPIPAHRTRAEYFNINAFAPPPVGAGRVGNASVGSLEGPGTEVVNAGLAKVVDLREGARLRFEATFTNVLNHTNFAPPVTNISNPAAFGALTTAQTAVNAGNRTGQVALRFDF